MTDLIKILFFASNPDNVKQLHLDEEIRSITMKIRASDYRDSLELISAWAARPDDLIQELLNRQPTVVHFSGHGDGGGGLVLMNDDRQAKTVSAAALKALFSTLKDKIRLVVLNACYSKTQAAAISRVIDCVVGMDDAIGDQAAITFAASFYRAIGFGRSVKEAFEQGKVSLMLEGIHEDKTPKLIARQGVDPALVWLLEVEQSPSDIIRKNLEVAKALYDLSPSFDAARRDRKEAISDYYQKISNTLKEVGSSLRANVIPHGACAKMWTYAEQLPEAIGDFTGADKANELSHKLKDAYEVERLLSELGNLQNREAQLINLDRAAAYFEASAETLLVTR